jgi:hypothetical protein
MNRNQRREYPKDTVVYSLLVLVGQYHATRLWDCGLVASTLFHFPKKIFVV